MRSLIFSLTFPKARCSSCFGRRARNVITLDVIHHTYDTSPCKSTYLLGSSPLNCRFPSVERRSRARVRRCRLAETGDRLLNPDFRPLISRSPFRFCTNPPSPTITDHRSDHQSPLTSHLQLSPFQFPIRLPPSEIRLPKIRLPKSNVNFPTLPQGRAAQRTCRARTHTSSDTSYPGAQASLPRSGGRHRSTHP